MSKNSDKQSQNNPMTSRQRVLAAMRCQPVDRIPFVPNLNRYALQSWPDRYQTMSRWEIQQELGIDRLVRYRVGVRTRPSIVIIPPGQGPVSMMSSLARDWEKSQPSTDKLKVTVKTEGTQRRVIVETPLGSLQSLWQLASTSDLPFPIEHLLKTPADFDIYHYILDHTTVEPAYEEIVDTLQAVGAEGTCEAVGGGSPQQILLEYLLGIENFYYYMIDCPDKMQKLMDHIMEIRRAEYRILAQCPAPIVITDEDTSTTMASPDYMAKLEFPALNEFADILHQGDKIHMVHMCGKIQGVLDLLLDCRFDGIYDTSPEPTGDLQFAKARERLCASGKCLTGGIDCNAFVDLTPEQMEDYVAQRLSEVAPGTGYLLGAGDTVPYGTPIENIKAVVRAVKKYGTYPLSGVL